MARATRAQLGGLKKLLTRLGSIESVKFANIGPMGADVYKVEYAHGSATWAIYLTPDGKTALAAVRPSLHKPLSRLPGSAPSRR